MGPRGRGARHGANRSSSAASGYHASASIHASTSASAASASASVAASASASASASAAASASASGPSHTPPLLDGTMSPLESSTQLTHHQAQKHITISNGVLMPSGVISRKITEIFKGMMHETGYAWKLVPAETKATYYEEFKKYFTWEPDLEAIVYEKWYNKAAERYKQMVHKFKVTSNRKRPDFIPASVWPAWIEYWNSDEVKRKSHVAKKNRLSEPDGPGTGISKHRGGSRCAEEHVLGLAKQKGVSTDKITEWDIFLRFHNPKGDEVFTYDKSKRVAREVRSRIEAMSQTQTSGDSAEGSGIDMTSVFLDVVGVSEKKHVFGLGNRSQIYSVSSGDSQSTSQIHTNLISNFEDRLQSLETELRDCQARLQTERDEGREEGRQETQQRMEELLQQQMQRQEQQMQVMIESYLAGRMSNNSFDSRPAQLPQPPS